MTEQRLCVAPSVAEEIGVIGWIKVKTGYESDFWRWAHAEGFVVKHDIYYYPGGKYAFQVVFKETW